MKIQTTASSGVSKKMKILYLGNFNWEHYTRGRNMLRGLKQNTVKVDFVNVRGFIGIIKQFFKIIKRDYDAILVTAAPEIIPQELIEQLKPGGKIVIPVGKQSATQSLQVLEKDAQGAIFKRDILPVVFVPLTRTQ